MQTGDTIAAVTRRLDCSFRELKRANPKALGRTSDGRWFLKDGVTIDGPGTSAASNSADSPAGTAAAAGTYVVAPGETVRGVCRKLGQPFSLLRSLNPKAVGRTEDGRWFFKAGATISTTETFDQTLAARVESQKQVPSPLVPPAAVGPAARLVKGTAPPAAKTLAVRETAPAASSRAAPDQTVLVETGPVAETARTHSPVASKAPGSPSPDLDPESDRSLLDRLEEMVEKIGSDLEVTKSFASGDISRPYQMSTEEVLRYKSALTPSLDLTLGLAQEHHRQQDILAGVSDQPVDRAVTMGLRFKF